MIRVPVDIETFSEVELKTAGVERYAAHPSALILVVSWGWEGELHTWDQSQDDTNRERFLSIATDSRVQLSAWNARFEWTLFRHVWGMEVPTRRIHCDMADALSLALPGSLARCGAAVWLPEKYLKQPEGGRLIKKFSKPRRPSKHKAWTRCTHETDPEDWVKYVEYNRQDVTAEEAIHRRLRKWL